MSFTEWENQIAELSEISWFDIWRPTDGGLRTVK
jgi:hypothetical protein